MTKEQEIAFYGAEIPEKYRGWVLGRNPPWTIEYYTACLAIAQSCDYTLKIEKETKVA